MASETSNRIWAITAGSVFATAVMLYFGNGMVPWWPLMWFAPLPVLCFALRHSALRSAGVACAAWFIGSLGLLNIFPSGAPAWVWMADFGGMALLFAAGVLLFRFLILRGAVWSGIAALPSLWVTVDFARNALTPHGTAADLAYTQLGLLPFLQLASLTGPWGMTFVLLAFPGALAAWLFLRKQQPRRGRHVLLVTLGSLCAVLAFGTVRLLHHAPQQTVTVGLIASGTGRNDEVASAGEDTLELLHAYADQARQLAARGAQVVVLPEKIGVVSDPGDAAVRSIFQPIADTGVTLVVGELHISPHAGGPVKHNRAEFYAPASATASYDKQHMLPPFESSLVPGTASMTSRHGGQKWGVAICKDMDFTSTGRVYGRLGTALMLVPAWDFNVDRVWHGHMAIMRGVESGFSVARAAKAGSLYASDNRGRILAETRTDAAPFATLLVPVPVEHVATLFQLWGDWFGWVAMCVLAGILVRTALLLR